MKKFKRTLTMILALCLFAVIFAVCASAAERESGTADGSEFGTASGSSEDELGYVIFPQDRLSNNYHIAKNTNGDIVANNNQSSCYVRYNNSSYSLSSKQWTFSSISNEQNGYYMLRTGNDQLRCLGINASGTGVSLLSLGDSLSRIQWKVSAFTDGYIYNDTYSPGTTYYFTGTGITTNQASATKFIIFNASSFVPISYFISSDYWIAPEQIKAIDLTMYPANASQISRLFTWSSSDTSVFTVGITGIIDGGNPDSTATLYVTDKITGVSGQYTVHTTSINSGKYYIQSPLDGTTTLYMNLNTTTGSAQAERLIGDRNQRWVISNDTNGYYTIRSDYNTAGTLAFYLSYTSTGVTVVLTSTVTDNMRWDIETVGSDYGSCYISPKSYPTMVLSVNNPDNDSSSLKLINKYGASNYIWDFYRIVETTNVPFETIETNSDDYMAIAHMFAKNYNNSISCGQTLYTDNSSRYLNRIASAIETYVASVDDEIDLAVQESQGYEEDNLKRFLNDGHLIICFQERNIGISVPGAVLITGYVKKGNYYFYVVYDPNIVSNINGSQLLDYDHVRTYYSKDNDRFSWISTITVCTSYSDDTIYLNQ